MKTVKSIIRIALRSLLVETTYTPADDNAYGDCFDFYVDMLDEFDRIGIDTGFPTPVSDNDNVGTGKITAFQMADLLIPRISSHFATSLTSRQSNKAAMAFTDLMSSQDVKQMAKNQVPTGYDYYNRYPVTCSDSAPNDCLEVEQSLQDDIEV